DGGCEAGSLVHPDERPRDPERGRHSHSLAEVGVRRRPPPAGHRDQRLGLELLESGPLVPGSLSEAVEAGRLLLSRPPSRLRSRAIRPGGRAAGVAAPPRVLTPSPWSCLSSLERERR